MVAEYGMSEALGPAAFKGRSHLRFLGVPGLAPAPFAEDTARLIDAEIKQLVVEPHTCALGILSERRNILDTVASRLM
jgi:cell division protease FtsH